MRIGDLVGCNLIKTKLIITFVRKIYRYGPS